MHSRSHRHYSKYDFQLTNAINAKILINTGSKKAGMTLKALTRLSTMTNYHSQYSCAAPVNVAMLPPASAHPLLGQIPYHLDLTTEADSERGLLKTTVQEQHNVITHIVSIYGYSNHALLTCKHNTKKWYPNPSGKIS